MYTRMTATAIIVINSSERIIATHTVRENRNFHRFNSLIQCAHSVSVCCYSAPCYAFTISFSLNTSYSNCRTNRFNIEPITNCIFNCALHSSLFVSYYMARACLSLSDITMQVTNCCRRCRHPFPCNCIAAHANSTSFANLVTDMQIAKSKGDEMEPFSFWFFSIYFSRTFV